MSGKRPAEKQITDRDGDDEDEGGEGSQQGTWKRASAAEIAQRKIVKPRMCVKSADSAMHLALVLLSLTLPLYLTEKR